MSASGRTFYNTTLGIVIGSALLASGTATWAESENPPLENGLPFEELRTFTDVLDRIKQDYVEEVDDRRLLEDAIRGMLGGLDPHSSYLDEDAYRDLQAGTSGEFGGLGIEVGLEDGFIKVISPIDDTPAQRAGVMAGDLIIRLDDTPIKNMSLNEAIKLMRGKPQTGLDLTIIREGEDNPITITVVRDIIQVQSIRSRLLAPNLGYVRITQFQSKTALNLHEALTELRNENDSPLQGLILDLRNNPGGMLNAAVEISDAFLDEGLVVYTEGRGDGSKQHFQATPGDVLQGAPVIVLVNGGSASASEIVAGALQDHRRAIIMGEQTFGKGSVQTILPLVSGTAVKLTTARYYTPDGRSIQAAGIDPDIKLESLQWARVEGSDLQLLKEADLPDHLMNDLEDEGGVMGEDTAGNNDGLSLARTDYQLYEALNLLKGLTLMQAKVDES